MKQHVVVFIREGGNLLLAKKKRSIGIGKWNGPGGKIEPGEKPHEAMVRECEEEIGITPTKYYRAAEIKLHEFYEGEPHHIFAHAFVCDDWLGEPIETEEMAPRWFAINQLPYDQMWSDDPHWLPKILEGKLLKAEFWLDQSDNVTKYNVTEVNNL